MLVGFLSCSPSARPAGESRRSRPQNRSRRPSPRNKRRPRQRVAWPTGGRRVAHGHHHVLRAATTTCCERPPPRVASGHHHVLRAATTPFSIAHRSLSECLGSPRREQRSGEKDSHTAKIARLVTPRGGRGRSRRAGSSVETVNASPRVPLGARVRRRGPGRSSGGTPRRRRGPGTPARRPEPVARPSARTGPDIARPAPPVPGVAPVSRSACVQLL